MDNSPRRSLSLKLDLMDLFFGMPNFPALNLMPGRKMFTEKKRKMECFSTQQVNYFTNEKLEKVCNILPRTWMEGVYDNKMNLGNYSPSLTIDLAKAIEKSMRQINCMKYPNKIIDMFNSEKITSGLNNIENLIYSKINENVIALGNITRSALGTEFQEKTTEQKPHTNDHSHQAIEVTTTESKECPIMEKPRVSRTWRKCEKIEQIRGKGRGKFQLRKSGVSQLKHRKARSKQNLHCNIQDDMDAWAEDLQDFPETPTGDSGNFTSPTNNYTQPDKTIPRYQTTDSDYPTLPQTFPSDNQPKSMKRIPKKNYDSPVSSPNDYVSMTCHFRSRNQSDSSIDSEESCCIVFQDDSESDSESADSDYESSSGEESEDDENDDQSNQKVRFILKPKIHMMIKWDFAYRAARRGPWEQIARDRDRFHSRINSASRILNPVLSLQHREQVYQTRFAVHD